MAIAGDSPVERATGFLRAYKNLYGQFMPNPFDRSGFERPTIRSVNALPDADPETQRRDFLLRMRGFQGQPVSTPDLDLSVRGTSGPGDQIVAFRQTYKGVPVFGADLLVFLRGQRVVGTVGGLLSDLDLSVRPRLTDDEALERALRALRADPQTAPLGRTHLVVFDPTCCPGTKALTTRDRASLGRWPRGTPSAAPFWSTRSVAGSSLNRPAPAVIPRARA